MTVPCDRPYKLPRRRVFYINIPDLGEFMAPHICHCWAETEYDAIEKVTRLYKFMDGVIGPEHVKRGNNVDIA